MAFDNPRPFRALAPLATVTLALGTTVAVLAAEGGPADDPKPAWRNGPVRVLFTSEEDKAYKALKTDEERAKAIGEFWVRRDPTPATAANEYRESFYKRVDDANKEFRESTGPGWATDKGKALLVIGYPKERKPGPGEGQETWLYSNLSSDLDALLAVLDQQAATAGRAKDPKAIEARAELKRLLAGGAKVVFMKSETGESSLSEGEELLNALRKLDPHESAAISLPREMALSVLRGESTPRSPAERSGAAPEKAGAGPSAGAKPAVAPEPTAPPPALALAPGVDRLKQAALGPDPKSEIGLATSARYYKSEDGSTRTVVLIAVKRSDIVMGEDGKPRPVLYARLLPLGGVDASPVEFLEPDLFSVQDDPAEGWVKCALAWPLKQRKYELRVAASDGPEGKMATRVETLDLPDFKSDALALSSITLARSSTQASGDPGEDRFRVGSLRLIPWVKPILGPKDELSFFYDVYNAKKSPDANQPSLDVAYVFEKKETSGWRRRGGLSDVDKHEETLGYSIPAEALSQWPAGEYRLTVKVKDKIRNSDVASSVEFSIVR